MKDISLNNSAIEAWLIDKVGSDAWEKFQNSTRTDIISSVACFRSFFDFGNPIDYSCAIIPVMKALEYELRIRFYDPYVRYLSERYSAVEYAKSILPEEYKYDLKVAAKLKMKILRYEKDKGLEYVDTEREDQFSLGNFCHSVRTSEKKGNRNQPRIDDLFLEYCHNVVFSEKPVSDIELKKWAVRISIQTEAQVHLRNKSAHGGVILNEKSAEKAISDVVTVGKLLAEIVAPSFG